MLGRKPAGIGVIPEKGQEQHKTTVWMGVTSSFRRCMCGPHLGSEAGSPGEPSRDSTNGPEAGARRNKRRKRSQRSWGGAMSCKYVHRNLSLLGFSRFMASSTCRSAQPGCPARALQRCCRPRVTSRSALLSRGSPGPGEGPPSCFWMMRTALEPPVVGPC